MSTMVVCVPTVQAARAISASASRMGQALSVRTVDCAASLLVELRRKFVETAIIDFRLAAPNPVIFAQNLRSRFPQTSLVMCGDAEPRIAAMVVAAGAKGVLRAPSPGGDALLVAFAQAYQFACRAAAEAKEVMPRQRAGRGGSLLSNRELEVLWAMCEGMTNAEIGARLHVSEDTVKTHAKRMYGKLGARDRAQAVARAFRSGLVA
ncbi:MULTISPECIES: helix-turn-helix transcriptional regulator [Glycomyces]|uniref:DNA-binding NarL/FixJ family response regulator n=2 Tax=Glycomyces artemisiae TaxID=1076443 RepID=A0A2T0UE12_9ACTN|nr:response regulator transcription factor [Glycomyces artemisiae]PRY56185.1 DNA-binding NarL/FixJ family response regulator [Glycomyces artemisiae]